MESGVKIVNVVAHGSTPLNMDAPEGECFFIAKKSKKISALPEQQSGVTRIFGTLTPYELDGMTLKELLIAAGQEGAERALKQHELLDDDFCGYGKQMLEDLRNANIVRSIVKRWCGREGKSRLSTLNEHLGVKDVVRKIKDVLGMNSPHREDSLQRLCKQFDAVDPSPGGEGFVSLIEFYLEANLIVHKELTAQQLNIIASRQQSGYNFGLEGPCAAWLTQMVKDLCLGRT